MVKGKRKERRRKSRIKNERKKERKRKKKRGQHTDIERTTTDTFLIRQKKPKQGQIFSTDTFRQQTRTATVQEALK